MSIFHAAAECYYYPLALEERLVNAVTAGDQKMAEEQLRQVLKENIVKRELSHSMLSHLISELEGSLLKSVYKISEADVSEGEIQKRLGEIGKTASVLERLQQIIELYKRVCAAVKGGMMDKSARIVGKIAEFLSEQYADPSLSLASVADRFSITGGYLSVLFKSEYGENFSAFLAKTRIERARQLLAQGKTLEYIAANVGYNSVQVLRKAFRRVMGVNPDAYRKAQGRL
ncbi:MAG: helix-turn-helix transcriptional regulator [Clostridiales bacterium]|jgi:YesN/AraC family two-component response regulator|nr:helix-turn-helix transcriptional regulator [Clostridiales bacterium]